METQLILAVLNLVVAIGTILSALVSWFRGGAVAKFIDNIGRIETIEEDVDEIIDWKDKTDTLLVALALGNENVKDRKAMEQVGMKTDYKDLLDRELDRKKKSGSDDD